MSATMMLAVNVKSPAATRCWPAMEARRLEVSHVIAQPMVEDCESQVTTSKS